MEHVFDDLLGALPPHVLAGGVTAGDDVPPQVDLSFAGWAGGADGVSEVPWDVSHGVGADALDARVAGLLPGVGLVDLLAGIEAADASEPVLGEIVTGWEAVAAWAAAQQAAAAAELAARRVGSADLEHLGDEIAAHLGHAPTVGRALVGRALALEELPEVRTALGQGAVCARKADVLAFAGAFPSLSERRAATVRVLAHAPRLGLRALRNRMNAEAAALGGEGAERNRRAARAKRHVAVEPVEDAMAYLSAYLPAQDAAAVWAAVDAAGTAIQRTAGESRTLGQARADALVALVTGRVVLPEYAPGAASEQAPGTASDQVAGAPVSRTTGPASGCTCGACVCGGTRVRAVTVPAQVRVTVSAGTLLGLDDAPGVLAGYGPVPAEVARTLAADGTWRRLVTDPVTGVLTDYSTTAYTPGKVLGAAVRARDETCTFASCDRAAERCDLDHVEPFDQATPGRAGEPGRPGQTRAGNLQALCRRHHRAKTHGGWRVVRDPDTGDTVWVTPLGRVVTRPATVVDPAHGLREPLLAAAVPAPLPARVPSGGTTAPTGAAGAPPF